MNIDYDNDSGSSTNGDFTSDDERDLPTLDRLCPLARPESTLTIGCHSERTTYAIYHTLLAHKINSSTKFGRICQLTIAALMTLIVCHIFSLLADFLF